MNQMRHADASKGNRDQRLTVELPRASVSYPIAIGRGNLSRLGSMISSSLRPAPKRAALVTDSNVEKLYAASALSALSTAGIDCSTVVVPAGERSKSLRNVQRLLRAFAESRLTRSDAVVALGGGVVGDLAGFAAAVYLRGIQFIQVPTTLLAMVDSSVGGKTGVNSPFGKNTVGAFHQPSLVVVDVETLATLPQRETKAGLCEMIKHAALSGRNLLNQTASYLDSPSEKGLVELIKLNIAFKAEVVRGDEIESAERTDGRSRKILNFGHTLAHSLEKVTGYRYFRHGEAVGYGILFAAELSKALDLIRPSDVELLNGVVHRVGRLPSLANIDPKKVFEAFQFDKKNVSGRLQMVLLRGIGRPVIVDQAGLPGRQFKSTLETFLAANR
jgi:3-dehydroquinate synthase